MIGAWLLWSGLPETEYWRATPAETRRAVRAGQKRRAVRYRDAAYAARLGQSAEKHIDRYLPRIEDDD